MLLKLLFSQKKTLCSSFKRKQDIFREKNLWIRRFGIRENMSRTSYKSYLLWYFTKLFLMISSHSHGFLKVPFFPIFAMSEKIVKSILFTLRFHVKFFIKYTQLTISKINLSLFTKFSTVPYKISSRFSLRRGTQFSNGGLISHIIRVLKKISSN